MSNHKKQIEQNRKRYEQQTELRKILEKEGRIGEEYCHCGGCLFEINGKLVCGDCGPFENQ